MLNSSAEKISQPPEGPGSPACFLLGLKGGRTFSVSCAAVIGLPASFVLARQCKLYGLWRHLECPYIAIWGGRPLPTSPFCTLPMTDSVQPSAATCAEASRSIEAISRLGVSQALSLLYMGRQRSRIFPLSPRCYPTPDGFRPISDRPRMPDTLKTSATLSSERSEDGNTTDFVLSTGLEVVH